MILFNGQLAEQGNVVQGFIHGPDRSVRSSVTYPASLFRIIKLLRVCAARFKVNSRLENHQVCVIWAR